ncbi:MAG: cyclic nucleotide-binding domain-containing protein [Candidatus Rokubacteria bacterium]|nr:cyclic nucleotide-binding domain-containing protein [Candidatus Rokubacteria bacterium]
MVTSPETLAFLREVRLFSAFTDPDLHAIASRLRERTLRKRQVLFREGAPGDEMFIVRRGTMLVSKEITGKVEQVLVRVDAGDFFGEMSLLDGSPRSASVQADTDATLLVLGRESLQALTDQTPHAAAVFFYSMVQVFIERLRRSTLQVAEATRWGLEATGFDVESR